MGALSCPRHESGADWPQSNTLELHFLVSVACEKHLRCGATAEVVTKPLLVRAECRSPRQPHQQSRVRGYPLTEPAVMPRMKVRCRNANKTMTGSDARMDALMIPPQSFVNCPR